MIAKYLKPLLSELTFWISVTNYLEMRATMYKRAEWTTLSLTFEETNVKINKEYFVGVDKIAQFASFWVFYLW